MTKKEFALQAIAPYYKDPSTCGYDGKSCCYLTKDGKMCVAGKYMLPDAIKKVIIGETIASILLTNNQSNVFKDDVVGKLTDKEWYSLQTIHDCIAIKSNMVQEILNLNLFTLEELKQYCNGN